LSIKNQFHHSAAVSFFRAVKFLLTGKIQFPVKYSGLNLKTEENETYVIFRNLKIKRKKQLSTPAVFIVNFKFKKFGFKTNKYLSLIPIPMIAGSYGFRQKIWTVDKETGFWQGLYEWDSVDHIEKYKRSFVLGMMNKRADKKTLNYTTISNSTLEQYLKNHTNNLK